MNSLLSKSFMAGSLILVTACGGKFDANPTRDYKNTGALQAKATADPQSFLPQTRVEYVVKEVPVEKIEYVEREVVKEVPVEKIKYVDREVAKEVIKYVTKEVPVNVDGRVFQVSVKDSVLAFETGEQRSFPVTITALQGQVQFHASLQDETGAVLSEGQGDGNVKTYTLSWAPGHSVVPAGKAAIINKFRVVIEVTDVKHETPEQEAKLREQLKVATKTYDIPYVVMLNTAPAAGNQE